MRMALIASGLVLFAASAAAQQGVVTGGSNDVRIGGQAAARTGDQTSGGSVITGGSSNVFINGRPAVTTGDGTGCGGLVISGGSNVFVNGKPLARTGDATTGCK